LLVVLMHNVVSFGQYYVPYSNLLLNFLEALESRFIGSILKRESCS
jgi:hypothetical protein